MNRRSLRLAAAMCLGIWLSGCGQNGKAADSGIYQDAAGRKEEEPDSLRGEAGREEEPESVRDEAGRREEEPESVRDEAGRREEEPESVRDEAGRREEESDSSRETAKPDAAGETEVSGEEAALPVIPPDDTLVLVREYIPDILTDLKYAAEDNFTGRRIYDFTEAYLRYGTVEKLKKAQEAAGEYGMLLKIWDAYRPVSAQFKLWDICPDPVYVANPNKGFSSHSRGNTVDITLVYEDGGEVEMPTGFDDFSPMADRDYSDCGAKAAENALLLEHIMKECGFKPYSGEWWHFSDEDSYPVEENFEPGKRSEGTE